MNPIYYQTVPKKKQKTDILIKDHYLCKFILDTMNYNFDNLKTMISKYDFIVFKPNIGGGGKNVGFLTKAENGYDVLLGESSSSFDNLHLLNEFIKSLSRKKFILQEGVRLLKYNDAPFDIRVEVQKPYSNWAVTGIVAKVAAKNKLVTNRHSGGTGMILDKAFNDIRLDRLTEIKEMLAFIGLRTARILNMQYEGIREVGIDVGLNAEYQAYILEINTKPQYGVFRQAGDKKMLNRIVECNKIIFDSIEYIKREL